jgi:LuxR family maltose regulon positive regulatory protein
MAVLGTKLHVPAPRRGLVPRRRLLDLLPAVGPAMPRLVLVSASAGFGKTTLLGQWLAVPAKPASHVAWLSLDDGDNDPRRFLDHLVAALRRGIPDGVAGAAALLDAGGELATEAVLVALVNGLDEVDGATVLVLDDYHVIDAAAVHDVVAFLLEHLPLQATVAIATRADPPLSLARLRSRADLVEVRAADLRFTPAEAGAFLNEVMGLDISLDQVVALDARTEGWPAGLQLAGLSLREVADPAAFVEAFTGSHRFVLDYLVEEVLGRQPKELHQFLLDTAVLDRMTAPLCDALTGRNDARVLLDRLDRANLFVVPLDDRREWYRYHHLFADAIRARLTAENPGRAQALHRAASAWFAECGLTEDAIGHAIAGGDGKRAADLIELALPEARRRRQDRTIADWMRAVPGNVLRQRPVLSIQQAWMHLVDGDFDGLEASLRDAERALAQAAPRDTKKGGDDPLRTVPAWIAIYRASAAQARGDAEATAEYARQALELAEPDDHFARGGGAGFLGMAAWADGQMQFAVDTFTQAVANLRAAGNVADELGSTVVLADMWQGRGRPATARRLYEQALETAARHPGAPLSSAGDLHVGLAGVLREHGELDAAEHHLQASTALGKGASLPENRHRWHLVRAGLLQARGDLDGAIDALGRADSLYLPGFFPDVRPIAAVIARTRIAQGHLDAAWDWAHERRVTLGDELSFRAEFDHLTFARLLIAQHRADGARDGLAGALGLLDRVLEAARAGARGASIIDAHLLSALAHDACGDVEKALTRLELALSEAVPAGYVRLFLDEGPPMARLLTTAEQRSPTRDLTRALLRAGYAPVNAAGEPSEGLSDREVEVLQLLATALSGPEIARQLFMSVNTFRTHTRHIFTKLDVQTRRAAVLRAADLGLL